MFRDLGLIAYVEGFLFVAILFLGLVYVWAKGDLDWVKVYGASVKGGTEVDEPVRAPALPREAAPAPAGKAS